MRTIVNNPAQYTDKEILVNAMCDNIAEAVFWRLKNPSISLEKEIEALVEAIKEKEKPMIIDLDGKYHGAVKDAVIRASAKLIIMALELQP